jgi:hypothetical protein
MESAEFNQHLIYKLKREQRSTGQTDTDKIVIDDMILNTDEMILNDWNALAFMSLDDLLLFSFIAQNSYR